jgi:hypothetical protein
MGLIHLVDEVQLNQHGTAYAVVVVLLSQAWLASLFFGFLGRRSALAISAAFALTEFAIQASTHFAIGQYALTFMVPAKGVGYAETLLLVEPACIVNVIAAMLCVSNPSGTVHRLHSFPFLLLALIGGSLVLLHAGDDLGRKGFGSLSLEDGALVAMLTATVWLMGSLWMASSRRLGLLLVIAATLNVLLPFYILHLGPGGVALGTIASQSGLGWAILAATMAGVALASLVASIGWLSLAMASAAFSALRQRPQPASQGVGRPASGKG